MVFHPMFTDGNDSDSYLALLEMDNGQFLIEGFVNGLGPNPLHGFRIHEFGDLSDGCNSCGGPFNPYGVNMDIFYSNQMQKYFLGNPM